MIAELSFYLPNQSNILYYLLRPHTILIKNFPRDTSMIAMTTADLIWDPILQYIPRTKSWQPKWPGRNARNTVAAMKVLANFAEVGLKETSD